MWHQWRQSLKKSGKNRHLINVMDGKKDMSKRHRKRRKLDFDDDKTMVAEEGVTIVKGSPWHIDWKSLNKKMRIVRAKGTYIYNNNEEKFLDCVSGVSHVGHCHPSLVAAAHGPLTTWGSGSLQLPISTPGFDSEDISLCNSGSRFCERILSSFQLPSKLNSTLIFNSGSQANDVALQIARAATGGHDVVIFEESFHGCLSVGNELSAKLFNDKHNPRGGQSNVDVTLAKKEVEKPPWVHVLPVPDLEAGGATKENEEEALNSYFLSAKRVIDEAILNGAKIACIITEPIFTFHSVLVPDSSFFRRICSYIKDIGGLVIIDEVQSGMCRTGHWWGFQIHDIEPDIITTGKALASGHPMSLLATSKDYVKTLNPCDAALYKISPLQEALGNAVFDVVEKENLKSHSAELGAFIKDYIHDLTKSRRYLGGVRGEGMLLGIQFVNANGKPDAGIAEKVLLSLRAKHIISAIEGKFGNVLFLIPPLTFAKRNALAVLKSIDEILVGLEKQETPTYPLMWPNTQNSTNICLRTESSDHFSPTANFCEDLIIKEETDNASARTNTSTSSTSTVASTSSSSIDNSYETMD